VLALSTADRDASYTDGFIALVDWSLDGPTGERTRQLVALLDASDDVRRAVVGGLSHIMAGSDASILFSSTGIPVERGFFPELADRLMNHFLPAPRDDHHLGQLLRRTFRNQRHVEPFSGLPPELFHRMAEVLSTAEGQAIWPPIRDAFADGFRLVAARVQAVGLDPAIRARSRPGPVTDSPFFRLERAGDLLLSTWIAGGDTGEALGAWRRDAAACRAEIGVIRRRLEDEGVSVDIVFGLEVLDRALTRLALMAAVLDAPPGYLRSAAIHKLLVRLVERAHEDRSVRKLFSWNLRLLHRKIVERASRTGEHYIAWTRKEYRLIWWAAAGGGLLTAVTATIKLGLHGADLPPFPEGFLYGLNYAISFLLLGAFGLVLATKQPAMTAATLAAVMRERSGPDRVDELVEVTTRISHSQMAAAIANVIVVSVGAYLLDGLWRLVLGHPFLGEEQARLTYLTLSPLDSGTVFFAALTGVILWASSIAGGWFDNWSVYHRLPLAIAEHPLGKWLGQDRMARWGERLRHQGGSWATSIALGFMLGMTPALGEFFGVPFDVRHVTLSTGTLAMAAAGLGYRLAFGGWFFRALAGIATMFVLNLGVSFALSLYWAVRAYELPAGETRELGRRLWRRFRDHPGDFFMAPKTDLAIPTGVEADETEETDKADKTDKTDKTDKADNAKATT
jgi:site-specific recombinase